jgi:hypothetical protein
VTDVFGENELKKKEELFVEFEVVTEDTEDLLSLEGRKFQSFKVSKFQSFKVI